MLDAKDYVIILVAFLKLSGLRSFIEKIHNIMKNGGIVTVFVGLDFYISDPKAISLLYKIIVNHSPSKLYLVQGGNHTFHPKICCGVTEEMATFLVGSANMTSGGMTTNFEASSYFKTPIASEYFCDFNGYLSELIKNTKTKKANLLLIDQYSANHKIFNQSKKKSEREAELEIKSRFQINIDELTILIEHYRNDEKEVADFNIKQKNYRKAKQLLKSLSSGKIKSKSNFITVYDQLVGAEGMNSLWHSGGLLRQKTRIFEHHKLFIGMVKEMEENKRKEPGLLFEIGMNYAKEINGLSVNVVTEIMNTLSAKKYSVLNKNPLSSLVRLGFSKFKGQAYFKREDYNEYNSLIKEFARICEFDDLSQVDHFLNYVYWKHVKPES